MGRKRTVQVFERMSDCWVRRAKVDGPPKTNTSTLKRRHGRFRPLRTLAPNVRFRPVANIADYSTSIECDVANFSARFVSVMKMMRIAAKAKSAGDC